MSEPVVITEKEYKKGRTSFDTVSGIEWVVTAKDEESVARAVRTSGARVAVLGVEIYAYALYEALEENAKGKSALIARYGVGYDGINREECKKRNIILAITPGALDISVAEHTIALMLCIAKNIAFCDSEMRASRFTACRGFELSGKVLAIIGIGKIGRLVSRMASYGFGMKVLAYDVLSLDVLAGNEAIGLNEFLLRYGVASYSNDYAEIVSKADIVSIHIPVLPSTLKFMNGDRISHLKKGALLINTSRGRLIDESALYDALSSNRLKGAALDVFETEPYTPAESGKDLRTLQNVILTPHIASDTEEANNRMQAIVCENIDAFIHGSFGAIHAVQL